MGDAVLRLRHGTRQQYEALMHLHRDQFELHVIRKICAGDLAVDNGVVDGTPQATFLHGGGAGGRTGANSQPDAPGQTGGEQQHKNGAERSSMET